MNRTFMFLAISAVGIGAEAKSLYVDSSSPGCSDATIYAANDNAHPWCTLQRAAVGADDWENAVPEQAAQAGDTVYVAAGTYNVRGSDSRYHPGYLPINSGNATDGYITFQAVGSVRLGLSSAVGPVIGAYRRSYIHWKGFQIDEASAPYHPDTGPVAIFDSDHIVIENCVVRARPSSIADNHNGIRFNDAHHSVARGNVIWGVTGSAPATSATHNYAAVMLYGSSDILIENNEIFDSNAGIFVKGNNNYDITIRRNVIRNVRKGIRTSYSDPDQGHNHVYQNVLYDGSGDDSMGVNIAENTNHYVFANNTIHNFSSGIYFSNSVQQADIDIQNNIISSTHTAVNGWSAAAKTFDIDTNVYFQTDQWALSGSTYPSITQWQAAISDDAGSDVRDPQFVDVDSRNFRLVAGSPSRNFGVDVLDLDGDGGTSDPIDAGAYTGSSYSVGSPISGVRPARPSGLGVE